MVTKAITYEDFNGEKRTENFYFNLTEAEAAELEVSIEGGFSAYLEKIVADKDYGKIVDVFKSLLLKSYGEKSDDGRYFKKNKDISDAFASSPAYSELFMELVTNEESATTFFQSLMPKVKERQLTLSESSATPSIQDHLRKQK